MEEELVLVEKFPAMSLVPSQPWSVHPHGPPPSPPPPPPPPPSSEPALLPAKSRKRAGRGSSLGKLTRFDDDAQDFPCTEGFLQATPEAYNWTPVTASPPPPPPPPPPPESFKSKSRGSPPGFMPGPDVYPPPPPPPLPNLPPPPPPPPMPVVPLSFPVPPPAPYAPKKVYSPDSFIDIRDTDVDSYLSSLNNELVRLEPFERSVFYFNHDATGPDFENYRWILQFGSPDAWYTRPSKATQAALLSNVETTQLEEDSSYLQIERCDIPRVWASAALTARQPDDDSICYDCDGCGCRRDLRRTCCVELVYYIIFSAVASSTKGSGRQVYKLFKCGSREAAVAEVFYMAGMNGWSVVFACVMRGGETFDERSGPVERVSRLRNLLEETADGEKVRVFY